MYNLTSPLSFLASAALDAIEQIPLSWNGPSLCVPQYSSTSLLPRECLSFLGGLAAPVLSQVLSQPLLPCQPHAHLSSPTADIPIPPRSQTHPLPLNWIPIASIWGFFKNYCLFEMSKRNSIFLAIHFLPEIPGRDIKPWPHLSSEQSQRPGNGNWLFDHQTL